MLKNNVIRTEKRICRHTQRRRYRTNTKIHTQQELPVAPRHPLTRVFSISVTNLTEAVCEALSRQIQTAKSYLPERHDSQSPRRRMSVNTRTGSQGAASPQTGTLTTLGHRGTKMTSLTRSTHRANR